MGAAVISRLGTKAGNRATALLLTPKPASTADAPLQRVAVNYKDKGETLYRKAGPGGKFKAEFFGTDRIKYELTRSAKKATATVRIGFIAQARDASGAWTGPIGDITSPAEQKWAREQTKSIESIWNKKYKLESKGVPVAGGALDNLPLVGDLVRAPKGKILLDLEFKAAPVFDKTANVHTKIRLFGPGQQANPNTGHPIDAGNWYMKTGPSYAGMDVKAISAHEYGHLLGLDDEYSRSNDQIHQAMHRMGGGTANRDKEFDANTVKQMIQLALYPTVKARIDANVGKIATNVEGAKAIIQKQLARAIRSSWSSAALRSQLVTDITPHLATDPLKRHVTRVVRFETRENLSNRTLAKSAIPAFTAAKISKAISDAVAKWNLENTQRRFKATDAGGQDTLIEARYSANVTGAASGTGAKAAQGGAVADAASGATAAGLPKVVPSNTILGAVDELPAHWKTPGKGLDATYLEPFASKQAAAAVKSSVAQLKSIGHVRDLYVKVLDLVTSSAEASAKKAVEDFATSQTRAKVQDQLATLDSAIDNEVAAVMGMKAGGVAAKSKDPNIEAVAKHLHGLLTSQQNPAQWKNKTTINPGKTGPGMDVQYRMLTMMGPNITDKSGFRADMIQPVVDQFNARLKRFNEADFKPLQA